MGGVGRRVDGGPPAGARLLGALPDRHGHVRTRPGRGRRLGGRHRVRRHRGAAAGHPRRGGALRRTGPGPGVRRAARRQRRAAGRLLRRPGRGTGRGRRADAAAQRGGGRVRPGRRRLVAGRGRAAVRHRAPARRAPADAP